jgi:hypothetical protein
MEELQDVLILLHPLPQSQFPPFHADLATISICSYPSTTYTISNPMGCSCNNNILIFWIP